MEESTPTLFKQRKGTFPPPLAAVPVGPERALLHSWMVRGTRARRR